MKKTLLFTIALALSMTCFAKPGKLVVTFDYEHQAGPGSNQYAVWIENEKGEVVKTLFVTSFTSKGRTRGNQPAQRGYTYRPTCVPTWVTHAKAPQMSDEDIDGVTGATPQANGKQTFTWDFTDQNGKKVAKGKYKVFVEATLINDCIAIYEGEFSPQGKAGDIILKSSLTKSDESHKNMITNVKAELL